MDNMGSLLRLAFVEADKYISLDSRGSNLFELTLKEGAAHTEIKFIQETGTISETEEETDHGTVYNFEASCSIAKCGPDNLTHFGDAKEKKLLIIGLDSNENCWLAGGLGSYFTITQSSSTGTAAADLNSMQIKISAALMERHVFIVSPF